MPFVVSAVAKEEHRGAHMNIVELIVELIGRNGDGHRLLANSNVIDLALFVSGRYVQIHASREIDVIGVCMERRRKRPSLAECLGFRNSDSSTRLHRHPIAQCHPKKHPVENNIETQIKRAIHRKTQRNTKDPQTCNPYCIRLRPSSEISS